MQRRALLASGALLATAGCLTDARRRLSGAVRHDHSRLTLHSVTEPFVTKDWSGGRRFRAWLFPTPPMEETTVFSDALGTQKKREWNNELRNERYEDGFLLLVQARSPATEVREAVPAFPAKPRWDSWQRVLVPFELQPRSGTYPNRSDDIVSTFLGFYTTDLSPSRAQLVFYREGDGAQLGTRITTLEARRWESE